MNVVGKFNSSGIDFLIIAHDEGSYAAQGLQSDICAQAETITELYGEVERMLDVYRNTGKFLPEPAPEKYWKYA